MKKSLGLLIFVEALAGAIGIISAIGSTCPTFIPPTSASLSIMIDFQFIFIITTLLSYVAAIGCLVLVMALWKGKEYFFNLTFLMALIGFFSGIIPAILVMMNGMPFSPSLLRTGAYLILIVILFIPGMKNSVTQFIESKINNSNENLNTPITGVSIISIGIGVITLIQLLVVPETHILNGINYYDYFLLQLIIALVFIVLGLIGIASSKISGKRMDIIKITTIN